MEASKLLVSLMAKIVDQETLGYELQATLLEMLENAIRKRYMCITAEHLLLALLDNESVIQILGCAEQKIDVDLLRLDIDDYVNRLSASASSDDDYAVEFDPGLLRVIQQAIANVEIHHVDGAKANGVHVLWGIINLEGSWAATYLAQNGFENPE